MKSVSLTFKAGAGALKSVKKDGFDISSIGTIAGASGGAKWLVLSQLDRAILSNLVPRLKGPVHLLGTSIGAWRFACYAQNDPVAAIDRFETAYIEQTFSDHPDIPEITAKSREIIKLVLGPDGVNEILSHPVFRTHVMAVRSRHILASENRWLLSLGLLTAAGLKLLLSSVLESHRDLSTRAFVQFDFDRYGFTRHHRPRVFIAIAMREVNYAPADT